MIRKLLKRTYASKAHPEKLLSYLAVREDILGIRILGEIVDNRVDDRRELRAKGLRVLDMKEYHPPTTHLVWSDGLHPQYNRYRESPGYYSSKITAYRPITRRESKRLIILIKANKERGIGSGL